MGFYVEQVVPRLVDKMCGARDMDEWRRRAVEGLSGTVLEIGFGSGLNVKHYPPAVERVLAVEPSPVARRLAARRIAESSVPIEFVGLDGQSIPLADASVDAALSTFTLCTIPDELRALREVFRVLRPGGELHVVEHGDAPDARVRRWQRRLEPINRRLAGGCHLTRDHWRALRSAGFELAHTSQTYARGPKTHAFFYVGVARKPAPAAVS
ncbi:MAG TPA: class I SAM-dependent methyltransferase [Acidimicrobiales bacterium]